MPHEQELELTKALLIRLVGEIDFVTSGGDDPADRCECGLAGVGMLRDARQDAVAYLIAVGMVRVRDDGRLERVHGS